MSDPAADPFKERLRGLRRWRCRLLGATFEFETNSIAAQRLVKQAFADLPGYQLVPRAPTLRLRIVVRPRAPRYRGTPPAPRFAGGADIVTATVDADNHAVLAPRQRSALLVLSSDLLQHAYHVRYELLEFTVITLAVRALALVPLHAACLADHGRGVLLLGASGSGKSTLALHGAACGLQLVSEDNLFVEPRRLRAAALPNYLYLRSSLPAALLPKGMAGPVARASVIRRRSGVVKRALDLRRSGLAIARRAPRIEAVLLLTRRRARDGQLLLRRPASVAVARLRDTQGHATAQPGWRDFTRAIARLPCFELRRGTTPADAVAAVRKVLALRPGSRAGR